MSSTGSSATVTAVEELISTLNLQIVANYCTIAAAVIVFHEHFLTLPQELRVMWTMRASSPIYLFFLNRYLNLLLSISFIVLTALQFTSIPICAGWTLVGEVCSVLLYFVWAVFSALRVFALSRRNWHIALLTLMLGCIPAGISIYYCVAQTYALATLPLLGSLCTTGTAYSISMGNRLVIASRSCFIASDFIVLFYTAKWYWIYDIKQAGRSFTPDDSLGGLMLKHGFIYFVVLAVLNVLHMTLWLTNVFLEGTIFIVPLSSILISRFLLNLRESCYELYPALTTSAGAGTTLKFAASFAAPLSHARADEESWAASYDSTLSVPVLDIEVDAAGRSEHRHECSCQSMEGNVLEVRRSHERYAVATISPTMNGHGAKATRNSEEILDV